MNINPVPPNQEPAIIALNKWLAQIGVSTITGWRWRRAGRLKTLNICGRVYITREAIAEFLFRAQAGEFAAKHPTPRRVP